MVSISPLRGRSVLIVEDEPLIALVDINLGGRDCTAVCRELAKRKTSYSYSTQVTPYRIWAKSANAPFIKKPATTEGIVSTVLSQLE